jgi:biotin carboxylase
VIEAEVSRFLQELELEQLVVAADGDASGESSAAELHAVEKRRVFAPPRVEKYTDMQDIILLDPVHEVGAAGWPQAAAAG